MALNRVYTMVCLMCAMVVADLQMPFPVGFSMGNMGTILLADGATGRQPWISAAYCDNTRTFGLACGAVSFYDRMDNFTDESIVTGFGGVYYAPGKIKLKFAVSHFAAMNIYYEQSGYFSFAADLLSRFRMGVNLSGVRIGLKGNNKETRTIGECGVSGLIRGKQASFSVDLKHIPVKSSKADGTDPPFCIITGFHSVKNLFGSQGVIIEVTPSIEHPIRFCIGEQYRFFKIFAVEASIANNPLFVAFGVAIEITKISTTLSLVNHSVLGWSKGFAVMY